MEDIIGILLYNSSTELPGSNHTFGEKQGLFSLLWARQAGKKKNMLHNA